VGSSIGGCPDLKLPFTLDRIGCLQLESLRMLIRSVSNGFRTFE
jgi:hypothetical protein